jgi:hypothetical protein
VRGQETRAQLQARQAPKSGRAQVAKSCVEFGHLFCYVESGADARQPTRSASSVATRSLPRSAKGAQNYVGEVLRTFNQTAEKLTVNHFPPL